MKNTDYNPHSSRAISLWLITTLILVMAMIVLGGATRLTNSGLSITEWKPITGALPPLSHEAWLAEFEKYKQIPEFEAEHPDMTLLGFEFVYSGLGNDRVDVSQYRLATHLGVAFIILGLLFWFWRDSVEGKARPSTAAVMTKRTALLGVLIYVQIIAGAFVAGTHSGKTYNTWPLMDGGVALSARQMRHLQKPVGILLVLILWQVALGVWTLLMVAPLNLSLLHQFSSILVFLAALWLWRSAARSEG